MIGWIKSLFGQRKTKTVSTETAHESNMLEQFEVYLADRMEDLYPDVKDAFTALMNADLPDSIKGLHIEVFLDDPGFSFRLFSIGPNDVWSGKPEPVEVLNDTIDRLWPIMTVEELDQYTIWEDDPKWGRQEALEQPLDKLNVPKIVVPWFKKIVSETRGDFVRPITLSVHDITLPQEL